MRDRVTTWRFVLAIGLALLVWLGGTGNRATAIPAPEKSPAKAIVDPGVVAALADGPVDVLVGYDPGAGLAKAASRSAQGESRQSRADGAADAAVQFASAKRTVAASVPGLTVAREFQHLPLQQVTVTTTDQLGALAAANGVQTIQLDRRNTPAGDNLTYINQPAAVTSGYTGAGVGVAVVDTGVDPSGAAATDLGDCSGGWGTGTCRIAAFTDISGSGATVDITNHGTNVAGIVAQVAPSAAIYAYGVYRYDITTGRVYAYDSDVLAALDHVMANGPALGIRAVNLSMEVPYTYYDSVVTTAYTPVFATLRAVGILPVVSAGNERVDASGAPRSGVSSPAATAGAVRVGAVYTYADSQQVGWGSAYPCYDTPAVGLPLCVSQGGPLLSLFAPGVKITAGGVTRTGTSQAAPHVSAAVALLASANPAASSDQLLAALMTSPTSVVDPCDGVVKPALDVEAALSSVLASIRSPGAFVSLTPARVLDTREGVGASKAKVGPNGTIALKVAGVGSVPLTDVSAVVLNVTVVNPTQQGNITVYPSDAEVPVASNLNFWPAQVVPNLVTVKLGTDGRIKLANQSSGTTDLVADVFGYYVGGTVADAGGYVPVTPSRLLDTRDATALGAVSRLGPQESRPLHVTGVGGVPALGVAAVVLNVTEVQPTQPGNLTVYPTGSAVPVASNLNYVPGDVRPNLVTVKVSPSGYVSFANQSAGTTHIVVDVAGYYLAGTPTKAGMFVPVDPLRLLDTRNGTGISSTTAVAPMTSLALQISGVGPLPPVGVSSVVLNVTETEPTAPGFVTVYPSGMPLPLASNLNFAAGDTYPNLVIVKVGAADGQVKLVNDSSGYTHLIADVAGYFLA